MKAIDLLKEYGSIDYGCDMSDLHTRIDEAIAELEELESRGCENCKHRIHYKSGEIIKYAGNGFDMQKAIDEGIKTEIYSNMCNKLGGTRGYGHEPMDVKLTFCCSMYEKKDD